MLSRFSILLCLLMTLEQLGHYADAVSEWVSEDENTVVRLSGRRDRHEGRIEICVDGVCGSMCHNGFDRQTANVVCRMFGYEEVQRESCCSQYGMPPLEKVNVTVAPSPQPTPSIFPTMVPLPSPSASPPPPAAPEVEVVKRARFWLDGVRCDGDENNIFECDHLPLGESSSNCSMDTTAGVRCNSEGRRSFPFRFLNMRLYCPEDVTNCNACPEPLMPPEVGTDAECSLQIGALGFVQVFLKETRQWHYVSAERWGDNEELSVLCGQLGFPAGLSIPSASDLLGCDPSTDRTCGGERFQREASRVTLRDVDCKINDNRIRVCEHTGFSLTNNPSREVATALCGYTSEHVCPPEEFNVDGIDANGIARTLTLKDRIRLRASAVPNRGRLEVYHDGEWGTVCGDGFTVENANVVCRSLGFGTAENFHIANPTGRWGFDKVWLENVKCIGNETTIESCKHSNWTVKSSRCRDHSHDVIVSCFMPQRDACLHIARFYRDFDPMQPRGISYYPSALVDYLEVNVGEEWGRVCANQGTVTSNHGRLICRQFTKKFLTAIESRNLPLSVDIPRFNGTFICDENDDFIDECSLDFTESNCTSVLIISCTEQLPDLVPDIQLLINSVTNYPHIERRAIDTLSCEIEEGCISNETLSSSPQSIRQLLQFTVMTFNFGLEDARPFANEQEWDYHTCHNHYHSVEEFAIYDLLNLSGERVAESLKASFCLMDSSCIPEFEQQRKYFCMPRTHISIRQSNQGITKGCGDAYGRNTPCQWVDVTDVPDGNYTLVVTINPNNRLQELDFENNQISCIVTITSVVSASGVDTRGLIGSIHGYRQSEASRRSAKIIKCSRRGYSFLM